MGSLIGRPGQRSRETYPEAKFSPVIPSVLPLSFESHSTGKFEVPVNLNPDIPDPIPFLVQDGGAALGFDIPQQEAGTYVDITFLGTMSNNGSSDYPQIQLVVNGVSQTTPPFGMQCFGGIPVTQGCVFRVLCSTTGVTQIRFTVYAREGHKIGTYLPDNDHFVGSWVAVIGILGR